MSESAMHVEDAMDSKLAKTFVRVCVWLAPFVIGAFGYFISAQLGDIKKLQHEQKQLQQDQATKHEQVASDVKVLKATLDNGVIWRITELERRLNTVEQATKTP